MDHEQIELRVSDRAVTIAYLGGIITMPVENLEDFIEALAEKSNRLKDSLERNYTTPSTN